MADVTLNSVNKLAHDIRTQWLALRDLGARLRNGRAENVSDELTFIAEELERLTDDARGIAND